MMRPVGCLPDSMSTRAPSRRWTASCAMCSSMGFRWPSTRTSIRPISRRLADVATLDAANQFLDGYLPIYNRRFAVQPAQVTDLHRPRLVHRELDRILCLKTTRCLRKAFTLAHQGGLYQIHDTVRDPHVLVEEHGDGTMRITHQGRPLGFHAITSRPVKAVEAKKVPRPRGPT